MKMFDILAEQDHEQISFFYEKTVGLRAVIAIHNTILGPALGGVRMYPFATEEEAVKDVCRLARGMTYKAAVAGINLGGGKGVIIGDPKKEKSEALFRAFGRCVESLGGAYITAEDMGTSVSDMEWVRMETRHVTGVSRQLGGGGDPSVVTAFGVYMGMKACVQKVYGKGSLKGLRVAVQGIGHVGQYLCRHLAEEGAKLTVTDVEKERAEAVVRDFGAVYVEAEKIYDVAMDIFSPCAIGGIIKDETIQKLQCKIIAGAANNQLENGKVHGQMLFDRGILYAPDYVINAGGLINVANELQGYNREKALEDARKIAGYIAEVIRISEEERIPTNIASNRMAERRIEQIAAIKRRHISTQRQVTTFIA